MKIRKTLVQQEIILKPPNIFLRLFNDSIYPLQYSWDDLLNQSQKTISSS